MRIFLSLASTLLFVFFVLAQSVYLQTPKPKASPTVNPSSSPANVGPRPSGGRGTANQVRRAPDKEALRQQWPDDARMPPKAIDREAVDNSQAGVALDKAKLLLREGKAKDALKVLQELPEPITKRFEIQIWLGITFMILERRDDAISSFRAGVKLKPTNAEAHSMLCRAMVQTERYAEATEACREAVRLDPDRTTFRAQLAELYLRDIRLVEVFQLLSGLDANAQNDLLFMGTLGDAYFLAGEYELAAEQYEKIARRWPMVSAAQLRLSYVYDYLDRFSESIAAASKFAELEPRSLTAFLNLGQKYQISGYVDEAIEAFSRAIAMDPKCGEAYLGLTEMYEITGDENAMFNSIKNAYNLMPRSGPLAFKYGELLIRMDDMAAALAPLELANKLMPNSPDVMRPLAFVLVEVGRGAEGEIMMGQANRISPLPSNIQINLNVKARQDVLDRFEELKEAVRKSPNDSNLRNQLGTAYRFKGMLKEAEEQYLEVIRLAPVYQNYNGLAMFYSRSRQYEKAVEATKKAIELNPHHVLYFSLAFILADMGRLDEAIATTERAIELKPDSLELFNYLGELRLRKGDRPDALRAFQKAFELASGDTRPNFRLAWLYLRMGNKEGALRHYEILRSIAPSEVTQLRKALRSRTWLIQ